MTDLRGLRERVGLKLVDVASRLEVGESTVRNWEKGRTTPTLSLPQFVAILRLYKCTPNQLLQAWEAALGKADAK